MGRGWPGQTLPSPVVTTPSPDAHGCVAGSTGRPPQSGATTTRRRGNSLSVDPDLQQTQDPYGYAGNDPVQSTDPDSEASEPSPTEGELFTAYYESAVTYLYEDSDGYCTFGIGHLVNGLNPCTQVDFAIVAKLIHGNNCPATRVQVIDLFVADYTARAARVERALEADGLRYSQSQRAALVDYDYWHGNLNSMTLRKKQSIEGAMSAWG